MSSKVRMAAGLSLILTLMFFTPVFAGGWAVISLDELPAQVVAGERLTIGFTVLQHGKTPMDGLEPTVTASLKGRQELVFKATPDGKPGHYSATLTFPQEGEWKWSIQAFSMDQLMPSISVAAPEGGVPASQPVTMDEPTVASPFPLLSIVWISTLGIGIAAMVFAYRRNSRVAGVLGIVCLLAGLGSFVAEAAVPEVDAHSKPSQPVSSGADMSQVELGGRLFVAKGCITCHVNNKVADAHKYWVIDAGPDLTNFSASPEALRLRLKDPASVKSDSQMPDLGLSEVEIEALIAFINSE